MNPAELLAFANGLADEADALTDVGFRRAMRVDRKGDGTVVTETDLAVERLLRDRIREAHPDHAVLGEEDGLTGDPEAPRWIIDPIDGTNNFVSDNPVWATLIALEVPGGPRLGVVSAPALWGRWDGLIDGDRGAARRNGEPITVSTRTLAAGQVSFGGLGYFFDSGQGGLVRRLSEATRRQRGFGDFWQHCLVAQGTLEVAVEAEVNAWDLAAVSCVVEAAGGRFTDLHGRATIEGGSALSTNGLVHDEVLALLTS